jgi:hypothetical protein
MDGIHLQKIISWEGIINISHEGKAGFGQEENINIVK